MNILQIQNRVRSLPPTPETIQYLNAAVDGQVLTVPPYIALAELNRLEADGVMDQLAQGAAKAPTSTVKDQIQQKMGIMALMGQQQPPQPPQIPQPAPPEQQPQAGGIDSLPVKEDMFGMAGGGIVAFQSGGGAGGYETSYDRMNQRNDAEAAQRVVTQPPDIRVLTRLYQQNPALAEEVALNAGPAGAALLQRVVQSAQSTGPTIGSVPAEREGERAAQRQAALQPAPAAPANTGEASIAGQDAINAALKAVGASTSKLPAMTPGQKPSAAAKPLGPRLPAAARPPVDAGISLADQAPGLNLADALDRDPAVQRMRELAVAANPYGGRQESQEDFIKRRNQGILSQIPGGKKPYETSEARLKEIEARRAKEDTDYAESNKGRQLDNLLTFIGGMGRGSFGNAGAQGIQAVQGVERDQRAEDLKRKDLRDQQSMKLMEIRTLNDQAQYAEATGNVTEFERLNREIKKLENEYAFKQAELSKELATLGAGARGKDSDAAAARTKLKVESEDRAKERDKDVQVERIRAAGQAAARASGADDKTVKMAEDAFTRDPEAQAIKKRLESSVNPAKRQTDLTRLREIQAEKYRQFGIRLEGAPSPAPAADGNRPPLSSFQR
jgi:hypothetical protein